MMTPSLTSTLILILGQTVTDPVHKILRDFPHSVQCLAFSPDGKLIATATHASDAENDAIALWDVATGKEVARLSDHYRLGCPSLAFSPDGKSLLVNGGPEETTRVWDVATRKIRLSLKDTEGIGGPLVVCPDSKTFAINAPGPGIRLYDMETGKERLALEGNFQPRCIAASPDGKFIGACDSHGTVALWNAASGKLTRLRKKHTRGVYSVAFSPDSKTLYSLGLDEQLIIWDTQSGQARQVKALDKPLLQYAALSPDGKTLAILGNDGLRLFDLEKGEFWPGIEWDYQPGRKNCVSFSPDGKFIATGSGGNLRTNSVYLYRVPERKSSEPKR